MIRKEFTVHKLNVIGLERASELARIFTEALNRIENVAGTEGREIAVVRAKLQEACFFAKRAIAEKTENQES